VTAVLKERIFVWHAVGGLLMDLESTQPYCMIPAVIHQIQNLQTTVSPPVYLEFDKVPLTKGFLPSTSNFPAEYHSTSVPDSFIHLFPILLHFRK
jgi:hypothetical protein